MQNVENLIKTTLGEIQNVINGKPVVGEPLTFEGTTIIPLISIGFAFGAGGIEAKEDRKQKSGGANGGGGGGGGIKPVALIIIDKNGAVTVEAVGSNLGSAVEKVLEKVPPVVDKYYTKWKEKREKEEDKEEI
jgi:uncharacterized spore protein YtfJ